MYVPTTRTATLKDMPRTDNDVDRGFRSSRRKIMRVIGESTFRSPNHSASDAPDERGASGRMATAGCNRTARRRAEPLPTSAPARLIATASAA